MTKKIFLSIITVSFIAVTAAIILLTGFSYRQSAEEAAKKAAKTRNVKLVFESLLGGTITPEDITEMLPKEATAAYIKIEENTIYWVGKNGEMGSIEIW